MPFHTEVITIIGVCCSLVASYERFGEKYCLQLQGKALVAPPTRHITNRVKTSIRLHSRSEAMDRAAHLANITTFTPQSASRVHSPFYSQFFTSSVVSLNFQNLCVSLTHCGRMTQICVFNTVKLGTSASSP
jgi:hypothetical protein